MERETYVKLLLMVLGGALTVLLTVLAVLPFLNKKLEVQVSQNTPPVSTSSPVPASPEELLVTVLYQMEEDSKKISAVYIEIFHVGGSTVSMFEIPADTKVTLSEELYKSLQTYAPELPQYLKVSSMAESFSEEYGLTGCNRILSELLGVSLEEYVRADKKTLEEWFLMQKEEKTEPEYFTRFTKWIEATESGRGVEERWMYYESRKQVGEIITETAPGSREKDGYLLSGKRCKERLTELMIR